MNASLSLCMIVKNEEKVLARCLDSVKHLVDEMIIVDTGSTDETVHIARRFTDNVHYFAWTHNFSDARNYALRQATKEYVLVLDADEYLDENSDLQKELASRLDYYLVPIKSYLSQGESSTHSAVRLFANRSELFYENHLHEHLNLLAHPSLQGGETRDVLIHHSGYLDESMREKDKLQRNLALMKKAIQEHKDGYNLFNMGKTYMSLGEYSKAVQCFKEAYPLSVDRIYVQELLTKLALSLGESGRAEEGLLILKDAVHLYPEETDMRYVQALLFKKSGYLKDAVASLKECLRMGDGGSVITEGAGSYKARTMLAEIWADQRKLLEGFDAAVQALQVRSNYVPALERYFDITLKARVPADNVMETIGQLYDIQAVEQLQTLLNLLYGRRHPLLEAVLTRYKITPQSHIQMVAKLYAGQYEEAYAVWRAEGASFPYEIGPDLVLLAYLRQDPELMKSAISMLNVSQREAKVLQKWAAGDAFAAAQLTGPLEELLLHIFEGLVVLQEAEAIEALSNLLMDAKLETRCRLAAVLCDYGQDKVAFDLLVKLYEERPAYPQVLELLGDLCCKLGYYDDAEVLYAKLMEQKPAYRSFERCYLLYESRRNFEGMRLIWQQIKERFPLSQWNLELGSIAPIGRA